MQKRLAEYYKMWTIFFFFFALRRVGKSFEGVKMFVSFHFYIFPATCMSLRKRDAEFSDGLR